MNYPILSRSGSDVTDRRPALLGQPQRTGRLSAQFFCQVCAIRIPYRRLNRGGRLDRFGWKVGGHLDNACHPFS